MPLTALRSARSAARLARGGALTAGLALALAACSGTSSAPASTTTSAPPASSSSPASTTAPTGPAPSGTATSSAPGSPSAGPTGAYVPASEKGPARNVPKPVMPAAMKQEDKAGAEAAVRYFWETIYYLQQTGDPAPMEEISADKCIFCSYTASSMETLYKSSGWYTGQRPSTSSIISRASKDGYISTSLMNFQAATGYNSDGTIAQDGNVPQGDEQPWLSESRFDSSRRHWVIESMEFKGSSGQ